MSEDRSTGRRTVTNARGDEFLALMPMDESWLQSLELDAPLTHALVVAKHQGGFLLVFNRWRQRWELPGGRMEPGETPRACALRELGEETNQTVSDLDFLGLMRFRLQPDGRIEYGALYRCKIARLAPFQANTEIADIVIWDLVFDIGYVDEIDRALIELNGGS